ncbi:MAG: hypothetical protein ABJB66_20595 [Gemmatimonadaceae bacterium]
MRLVRNTARAATSLALFAAVGCSADNVTSPIDVTSTRAPLLVSNKAASTIASDESRAVVVSTSPTRATLSEPRYAREQVLGFQNGTPTKQCLGEGESLGAWNLRFSGYGCTQIASDVGGASLSMQPAAATGNSETHAPLLLGPQYGDRFLMTARFETVQQLRTNGKPNAWEVAWVLWQYQDDEHFYYFIPKPNGWELGKRDPSYAGGQRFLATGSDQKFPVGHLYNVQIAHRGNAITVTVDGIVLASIIDTEHPYVSGRVALYSEDAEIKVHQVSVRTGAF